MLRTKGAPTWVVSEERIARQTKGERYHAAKHRRQCPPDEALHTRSRHLIVTDTYDLLVFTIRLHLHKNRRHA